MDARCDIRRKSDKLQIRGVEMQKAALDRVAGVLHVS